MLSPTFSRNALSLELPNEKLLTEHAWRNHMYTCGSGLETPPSEASTPPVAKDSPVVPEPPHAESHETDHSTTLDDAELIRPTDAPTVAIMGVGYVGTHLVSTFATKYPVIGFDVSKARVRQLSNDQAAGETLSDIEYTCDAAVLRRATHFLISVPTLLRHDRTVDASFLSKALQTVWKHARPGATVVIESSVAVGMTRELLGPLAMQRGLFAGMSPEVSLFATQSMLQ